MKTDELIERAKQKVFQNIEVAYKWPFTQTDSQKKEMNMQSLRLISKDDPDRVYHLVENYRQYYDSYCKILEIKIEKNQSLSDLDKSIILGMLRGNIKRPPNPKGAKRNDAFNIMVFFSVRDLEDMGFTPKRNDATDPDQKPSACDIIAMAMQDKEKKPDTYEAIAKCWDRIVKKSRHIWESGPDSET
jgi:hypothetical protein